MIKREYLIVILLVAIVVVIIQNRKNKEHFQNNSTPLAKFFRNIRDNIKNKNKEKYSSNSYYSSYSSKDEETDVSQMYEKKVFNGELLPDEEKTVKTYKKTELEKIKENLGTVKKVIEYPIAYPLNYDYSAFTTVLDNSAIGKINELTSNVRQLANQSSTTIFFNPSLRPTIELQPIEEETNYYGKYLVSLLNEVSPYSNYKFNRTVTVGKIQHENQVKLHFILKAWYLKTSSDNFKEDKIELNFETIILFEKVFGEAEFYGDNKTNISSFLQMFNFVGLPNNGFIPPYNI